ncbi:hypothetical protein [Glycomyces rhizosphaerae]|uniref:Uncharacterized protein n=1 Tax=Glycomyces rhizosphaerae TaxID=2054422 RepID=A0ABV7Q6P6_9ACTN
MSYPPPPGYGQQPQQPGYPPQQPGGYAPQPPQQPYGQPSQPGYGAPQQPGYGAPQQPGYPPQAGGAYGAPPPIPPGGGGGGFGEFAKETGKGLLWKIVPVILVVLGLGIYLVVKLAGGDSAGEALDDLGDSDTAATVAEGDCLIEDLTTITGTDTDPTAGLTAECEATEAFWTVSKLVDDPDLRADSSGTLEDYTGIETECGAVALRGAFGEVWQSYFYVYDWDGGKVDYLMCLTAIEKENADGGLPITPNVGDCTNDDLVKLDCSAPGALYVVDEVEAYDPPLDISAFDYTTAVGGCANSGYYAAELYGGDELIWGAMCRSDNA